MANTGRNPVKLFRFKHASHVKPTSVSNFIFLETKRAMVMCPIRERKVFEGLRLQCTFSPDTRKAEPKQDDCGTNQ